MYLSNIRLWNFRRFGSSGDIDLEHPNLDLSFNKGMNVLVGENDSGKTAVIDAIKLVLKTQDFEWIRVNEDDFYNDSNRFRIELRFDDLKPNEAKNFTEWLCYEDSDQVGKKRIYLRLIYDVHRNEKRIFQSDVCAGADDKGSPLPAEAKDFLKTTYLKPLRDAAAELVPGRYSRLANILNANEIFQNIDNETKICEQLNTFNQFLTDFFSKDENEGSKIKVVIDEFVSAFCNDTSKTNFTVSSSDIKGILSKIELSFAETKNPGLGSLNRLYMATELLNLKRNDWDGLKLCLVEELEAHLHPQAQMKVVEKIQACSEKEGIQFILTTHSPNLSSKIHVPNLFLCNDGQIYPLNRECTRLDESKYNFLEKFLDVTKSNMFFAKGLIFVEGWAEEILLPTLAEILKSQNVIKKNLTEAGVSIINVGNVGFLNYVDIFKTKDGREINIPIAIITDSDVPTYEKKNIKDQSTDKVSYIAEKISEDAVSEKQKSAVQDKETRFNYGKNIKAFIAKDWTLEYALYLSSTCGSFFKTAITNAHPQMDSIDFEKALAEKLLHLSAIDKTTTAYNLAKLLHENEISFTKKQIENDSSISYLVDALKFVCK